MPTFRQLAETETDEHHKNIFSLLAEREADGAEVEDGAGEIVLDSGELAAISGELFAAVKSARGDTQSLEELRSSLRLRLPSGMGMVSDGYENATSGIGSPIDPGMQTEAFIPVCMSPQEAAAYYAGGGLPARIINKKAGCLGLNGQGFVCPDWKPDDLQRLSDYAEETGFFAAYLDTLTQALTFGGAAVYPAIRGDTPLNLTETPEQILERVGGRKNFIRHWVVADRWNCVFVPSYRITAQDYLFAKTLFIPLGGVRVSTGRMALVRPSRLPFWAAIQQMGWSTSDFEGWAKDFEAYKIMAMSLPIMAQQSSLMYHAIPADSMILENGPLAAREYFRENEEQLRKWSMLHPRAINSIGEIKVLERTYSGFRDLVQEAKLALCASSGVAESILFEERATGLASDNRDDVTLKQSEMIRLLFNVTSPAFKNVIRLLVCSCFGAESEQAKAADRVRLKPDNGFVLSEMDKAAIGSSFVQIFSGLVGAGLPLSDAVSVAKSFAPSAEIPPDIFARLAEGGEGEEMDSELWALVNAGRGTK